MRRVRFTIVGGFADSPFSAGQRYTLDFSFDPDVEDEAPGDAAIGQYRAIKNFEFRIGDYVGTKPDENQFVQVRNDDPNNSNRDFYTALSTAWAGDSIGGQQPDSGSVSHLLQLIDFEGEAFAGVDLPEEVPTLEDFEEATFQFNFDGGGFVIGEITSFGYGLRKPLAYWDFEELDADGTPDVSGNGNDGTKVGDLIPGEGAPLGSTPGRGGAFSTNVPDRGHLDIPEISVDQLVSQNGSYTFATWLRPTFRTVGGNYVFAPSEEGFQLGITPSGRLVTQNSAGDQGIGSTNIALDEWVHVVWTYDGENDRASIYLNGEPEVEDDPQAPNGTGNLKVGSGRSGGLNFIGLLDDVAVWDSLLTRAEIALLAEGASPVGQETVLPSGLGYTLSGRVQTPDGVPAVGATVRATPIGAETITDGEGRFSFTELSPSDGAISLFANFTDGGNTTWSGFCPRVRRDEGDIGNLFCAIILTEGTPLAKVYEFSEVGVLPDSDEGEFFNNSGSPTSSVFTVENGFLEQRTFEINGNVTYFLSERIGFGSRGHRPFPRRGDGGEAANSWNACSVAPQRLGWSFF